MRLFKNGKKNWVRTGRTELPVRPLARCRPRTIERRRLPTARGSVSSWRCSSAHFLFLVLSSLPFLHSSSFRSAADPHHRSCSRSPSPELQQIPIAGATALPAPGGAPAPARLSRPPRCPSLLLPVGPPSPSPTATPPGGASARPALRRPRPLPSASAASPAVGRGCCYLTVQSPSPFGLCLLPCLLNWLGPFH